MTRNNFRMSPQMSNYLILRRTRRTLLSLTSKSNLLYDHIIHVNARAWASPKWLLRKDSFWVRDGGVWRSCETTVSGHPSCMHWTIQTCVFSFYKHFWGRSCPPMMSGTIMQCELWAWVIWDTEIKSNIWLAVDHGQWMRLFSLPILIRWTDDRYQRI